MYAGQPDNVDDYQVTQVDGLTVYVPKDANTGPEGIRISLISYGLWKRLAVSGLRP